MARVNKWARKPAVFTESCVYYCSKFTLALNGAAPSYSRVVILE